MSNYNNNYKVTALNYSNNYCYIEAIFDLSKYINTTIDLSVNSIIESSNDLSFTLQQVNSSDLPKLNYFKEYFLLTSTISTNNVALAQKEINLKYNYLNLVLGIKLSNDSKFTIPFDFIYRFNFSVNDTILSPLYFGETINNIANVEVLGSPVITPPSDPINYASKNYVDSEIKKVVALITKIEVYPLNELAKIEKEADTLYLGY